jgi:2,3-bisphosphoglycerate-dependent phosphoglycerate mutase
MRALGGGAAVSPAASLVLFVGHGGAFRHAASQLGLLGPADVPRLSMDYGVPIFFEFQPSRHDDPSSERWQHIAGDWRERPMAAPAD